MLEEELRFYQEQLPILLERHYGKFVLIHGTELIGSFNTQDDALREGARRFGLSSFLIRQVAPTQEEVKVPALTLGLLIAYPPPPIFRSNTSA